MARLIQDIVPDKPQQPQPLSGQAVQRIHQVHNATNIPNLITASQRRASSFDIIRPTYSRPKTQVRPRTSANPVQPKASIKKTKVKARVPLWRRSADFAQYPLIAAIAIAAAYSSSAGQVMVLIFGVICLLARLQSRYSFAAALLLLASIPLFQVIHESGVSQNAAIYAYELLVVGTMLAIIELWRDNRQISQSSRFSTNLSKLFNR